MISFILFVFTMVLLAGAAPIPRSPVVKRDNPKFVTAHHMVGNTYPYTTDTWLQDINLAYNSGIDAFALNLGTDSWQPNQIANAFQAAQNSGTGFKLFFSFDMTVFPCSSAQDAVPLRNYITQYASHPNQLRYNGDVFASTFAGDTCTFGAGSPTEGWKTQFIDQLTGNNKVHFVPAFFSDPNNFKTFDNVIDGVYNWNSGWPVELTTQSATSMLQPLGGGLTSNLNSTVLNNLIGSMQPDNTYLTGLTQMPSDTQTYMAAVSPWFFTHYGPDSFNKNWIYMSNDHLYNKRWETIIGNRNTIDIVQIVTWNDYGESHYIGPIEGDQPNSQDWVDGFDHTAWLDMTSYYANAFKTGSFPDITEDKLYMWARPHPRDAVASNDPVGKPDSFQLLEDVVFAVVMATSPSTVLLSTGPSSSQSFDVPAGVTKLTLPIAGGGTMYGKITRNGNTVVELNPDFTFNSNPTTYNYNAMVTFASSNQTTPSGGTPGGTNTSSSSSVSGSPSSTPLSSSSSSSTSSTPSSTSSPAPSSTSSPTPPSTSSPTPPSTSSPAPPSTSSTPSTSSPTPSSTSSVPPSSPSPPSSPASTPTPSSSCSYEPGSEMNARGHRRKRHHRRSSH